MAEVKGKTFTATIARTNSHGFQTREQPGVWLNLSKFDDPQPAIPEPGTVVKLTLDGSGFVRAITPGTDPQPPLPLPAVPSERERVITRLAVLKAAARFLADKPDAKSPDVLIIAALWERWVTRGEAGPESPE